MDASQAKAEADARPQGAAVSMQNGLNIDTSPPACDLRSGHMLPAIQVSALHVSILHVLLHHLRLGINHLRPDFTASQEFAQPTRDREIFHHFRAKTDGFYCIPLLFA